MSQLFIKGTWTLPYTLDRINQALHRAQDDPLPLTPALTICGIGKAIGTVCIVHNLIKEQQTDKWRDFTLHDLDTQTVSNTEKVRTQLSFRLQAVTPEARPEVAAL